MVLEYSGRSLAFIEMASHIKQMICFFLIAQIIFPITAPHFTGIKESIFWISWYIARIGIIAVITALVEVSVAKMRLFRVVDFLGFGFAMAIIAVICACLGV